MANPSTPSSHYQHYTPSTPAQAVPTAKNPSSYPPNTHPAWYPYYDRSSSQATPSAAQFYPPPHFPNQARFPPTTASIPPVQQHSFAIPANPAATPQPPPPSLDPQPFPFSPTPDSRYATPSSVSVSVSVPNPTPSSSRPRPKPLKRNPPSEMPASWSPSDEEEFPDLPNLGKATKRASKAASTRPPSASPAPSATKKKGKEPVRAPSVKSTAVAAGTKRRANRTAAGNAKRMKVEAEEEEEEEMEEVEKKRGGRQAGAKAYNDTELNKILGIMAHLLPTGRDGWEVVAAHHAPWCIANSMEPRKGEDLEQKMKRMKNTVPPTGDPNPSPIMRRILEVFKEIEDKAHTGMIEDEDDDDDEIQFMGTNGTATLEEDRKKIKVEISHKPSDAPRALRFDTSSNSTRSRSRQAVSNTMDHLNQLLNPEASSSRSEARFLNMRILQLEAEVSRSRDRAHDAERRAMSLESQLQLASLLRGATMPGGFPGIGLASTLTAGASAMPLIGGVGGTGGTGTALGTTSFIGSPVGVMGASINDRGPFSFGGQSLIPPSPVHEAVAPIVASPFTRQPSPRHRNATPGPSSAGVAQHTLPSPPCPWDNITFDQPSGTPPSAHRPSPIIPTTSHSNTFHTTVSTPSITPLQAVPSTSGSNHPRTPPKHAAAAAPLPAISPRTAAAAAALGSLNQPAFELEVSASNGGPANSVVLTISPAKKARRSLQSLLN